VLAAAALALVLQSLAPPGYMPGSISSGWPVILCPEGLPPGFLGHVHGHHQGASGKHKADMGLDGHCPLGSILGTVALAATMALPAGQRLAARYGRWSYNAPNLVPLTRNHPSRAPPALA
jgi:hypothetical protein